MLVSITEATKMVGIKSRSTFYRHIDKKGITVEEGDDGNPKIDISELIRVYGDRVKMPKEVQGGQSDETGEVKQSVHSNTTSVVSESLQVLKERTRALEEMRSLGEKERQKEREHLADQIETLRTALNNSQEQQKRLTLLITDQRDGQGGKADQTSERISKLETLISDLSKENKRLLKIEEERKERIRQLRARRAEEEQKKQVEAQKSRGLFQKLFG